MNIFQQEASRSVVLATLAVVASLSVSCETFTAESAGARAGADRATDLVSQCRSEEQAGLAGHGNGSNVNEAECEWLIRDLRTSLPPPKSVPHEQRREYHGAPVRIRRIIEQLEGRGLDAFPFLVRHADDGGDSYYLLDAGNTRPDDVAHVSVGMVCQDVICHQVDQPMRSPDRLGIDGKSHVTPRYFSGRDLGQWWNERKTKSLQEIRLEIVDWYIQQERAIGFPRAQDEMEFLKPLIEARHRLMGESRRTKSLEMAPRK